MRSLAPGFLFVVFLGALSLSHAFVSNLARIHQRALFVPTHQEAIDSMSWPNHFGYSSSEDLRHNNNNNKDAAVRIRNAQQTTLLNRLPTAFSRRFFFNKVEPAAVVATASSSLLSSSSSMLYSSPQSWIMALLPLIIVANLASPHTLFFLQRCLAWYVTQLDAAPLLTKSLTSGVIGLAGDCLAQTIERIVQRKRRHEKPYDPRRGLSVMIEGLLISGPMMHVGYDLFERILPVSTANGQSSMAAMLHVIADSILLDSTFIGSAFVITGIMEGYKLKQIGKQLRSDYVPTLLASWVTSTCLMPIEFMAFRFLPVSLRVLAVKFIDVIWDTVVSFMTHKSRSHDKEVEATVVTATAPALTVVSMQPALAM
jgi:hypothetical protein